MSKLLERAAERRRELQNAGALPPDDDTTALAATTAPLDDIDDDDGGIAPITTKPPAMTPRRAFIAEGIPESVNIGRFHAHLRPSPQARIVFQIPWLSVSDEEWIARCL
jgi:hypothetical protein